VALIAAAISKDDAVVLAQVTNSVSVSVRMFVVGAAVTGYRLQGRAHLLSK
jgi:hypothetical protein